MRRHVTSNSNWLEWTDLEGSKLFAFHYESMKLSEKYFLEVLQKFTRIAGIESDRKRLMGTIQAVQFQNPGLKVETVGDLGHLRKGTIDSWREDLGIENGSAVLEFAGNAGIEDLNALFHDYSEKNQLSGFMVSN